VAHEVGAFLRREEPDRGGDQFDDLIESAGAGGAEKRLQFGKRELDDPRLVEKLVVPGIAQGLDVLPAAPRRGHVSAPLFVGVSRFC